MRSMYRPFVLLAALGAIALPLAAQTNSKKTKAAAKDPRDSIEVVGHIPAANGPVARFLSTQHYSSYYLYAEHEAGRGVTMIDVTKVNKPSVLADMSSLPAGSDNLAVVAGTAALVSTEPVTAAPYAAQTIRIMDFSDPQNPRVTREFAGVTATSRDDRRGLIFVANPEGIWILQQHLAEDPEVERAYAYSVVYGPGGSMFPPPGK
jgi:hypothetical protein